MTTEELAKLTPEQKRIRIAELCGWHPSILMSGVSDGPWFGHKSHATTNTLPDYLNDLNAMHEAEEIISAKHKQTEYAFHLRDILLEANSGSDWWLDYEVLHATAAQRADAFLLTLA